MIFDIIFVGCIFLKGIKLIGYLCYALTVISGFDSFLEDIEIFEEQDFFLDCDAANSRRFLIPLGSRAFMIYKKLTNLHVGGGFFWRRCKNEEVFNLTNRFARSKRSVFPLIHEHGQLRGRLVFVFVN